MTAPWDFGPSDAYWEPPDPPEYGDEDEEVVEHDDFHERDWYPEWHGDAESDTERD